MIEFQTSITLYVKSFSMFIMADCSMKQAKCTYIWTGLLYDMKLLGNKEVYTVMTYIY
jgi:hypothetical protein